MQKLIYIAVAVAALFLGSGAAEAQTRPTQDQLERLITQALADPETVTFARPQILGFNQTVTTNQLGYEDGDFTYYISVTKPRLKDGLIIFSRQKSTGFFAMHRTDMHLQRIASARNDMKTRAGLTVWTGSDADKDFARQLAYWARFP